MQIPKEVLSAENYTGSRLIPLKSFKAKGFKKEINKIQKAANPILLEMEKLAKGGLDDFYAEIKVHQDAIKDIQEKMKPLRTEYDDLLRRLEAKDNQAQLIKNKLQPIVEQEIEGQLEEFEKPYQVVEKDGKLFVEVVDSLEEFIKSKRNATTK